MAAEDVRLKEQMDKLSKEIAALEVYVDQVYQPTVAPSMTFAQQGSEKET